MKFEKGFFFLSFSFRYGEILKPLTDTVWSDKYASFVSFWPLWNPAQLADGPTLYGRWQGQGTCSAPSANPLSLSPYKRLASSLPLQNLTDQELANVT
jgi:hypothetical protein